MEPYRFINTQRLALTEPQPLSKRALKKHAKRVAEHRQKMNKIKAEKRALLRNLFIPTEVMEIILKFNNVFDPKFRRLRRVCRTFMTFIDEYTKTREYFYAVGSRPRCDVCSSNGLLIKSDNHIYQINGSVRQSIEIEDDIASKFFNSKRIIRISIKSICANGCYCRCLNKACRRYYQGAHRKSFPFITFCGACRENTLVLF